MPPSLLEKYVEFFSCFFFFFLLFLPFTSPCSCFNLSSFYSSLQVPVIVKDLGVDLLTICPHKFYGPKGVGALCIRTKRILRQQQNINARQNQVTDIDIKRGVKLRKQMHGASHERDLRAGTENIILIAGLGICMVLNY